MISCVKKLLSVKPILAGLCCVSVFTASAQTMAALGNLPLYFEANLGHAKSPAQFLARGRDCQFLVSPNESQLILRKADAASGKISSCVVRMQFVNANAQAQVRGDSEQPGKINYLIGNDPAQWRTGVATFAKVRVEQLYPSISLVYYGNQQQLEYDFTVAPHANPQQIAIQFAGVDKISVGPRGELILTVGKDEIRQPKPLLYQTVNGTREEISGGYKIVNARTVAFDIGKYNHALPLVIDPILSYSTYFGGNVDDTAWAISLDTNGFIYVAGGTRSTQFAKWTVPPGAFQTNFQGGAVAGDAFVAKFNNTATNLIYLTYLGGGADDAAYGLAVDGTGDAYIAGATDSANFPVKNPIYPNISGVLNTHVGFYPFDGFVAELDPNGSNLLYSTYLGGGSADAAFGIALDLSNNAYVVGITYSTNFPTTTNAFQKHIGVANGAYQAYSYANAFVAEISASGTNLLYSSYFGGTNFDVGERIAVDNSNFVYVTGFTASTNFPNTNAFQQYLNGSTNAFVAKFGPSCTNLVYSTFLGGTNSDVANSIAIDALGKAYVTGWTTSTNFPNTVDFLPNSLTNNSLYGYAVTTNAFLTQITWDGTNASVGYSAVFGGNFTDIGEDVAVDPSGNAFVVGTSSSTNFPTFNTSGLLSATNSGGNDVFVIAFSTDALGLFYSACLGGLSDDFGYGIALDPVDNAYIVGQTASTNFPVLNARQTALNGAANAFLAKILLQQPALTLINNGGNATFAWPAFEPEFTLESNTNLLLSNTWVTVPLSCVLSNGFETITVPATNNDLFFRLHKF
jgi:Beta-propeller repeat